MVDFLRRHFGGHDRFDEAAFAHRCCIDMLAIRDRVGHAVKHLGILKDDIGASRGRASRGIRPAIARGDKAHLGQAEIEHGAGRLANILPKLRPNKNENRGHFYLRAASAMLPAKSSKSRGSVKSR